MVTKKPITIYTKEHPRLPNISQLILQHALDTPEDVAFLCPNTPRDDWVPLTWACYGDFLYKLANSWLEKFQPLLKNPESPKFGDAPVAAVMISPAEDFFAPFFALSSIGFTAMPVNPFLSADMVAEICDKGKVSLIVAGGRVSDIGNQVQKLRPNMNVHVLDPEVESMAVYANKIAKGIVDSKIDSEKLIKEKEALSEIQVPDPAYLLHSTGSTSAPKIIPWSNSAIYAQIRRNVVLEGFMNPDRKGRMGLDPNNPDSLLPINNAKAPGWPVFITKEPFAIAPIGIALKIMFLGAGWPIALPLFPSTSYSIAELLENLTRVGTQEYSVYSADMGNICRYLDDPGKDEEEQARKNKYLEHLRSLGPMPCGGSRVERWTMQKAIKLGIQVQVTLGTTEGGFVMASKTHLLEDKWGKEPNPTKEDLDRALAMKAFPDTPLQFLPTDEVAGGDNEGAALYELVLDAHEIAFSSPTLANDGNLWRTRDLFRKLEGVNDDLYIYETRRDDMLMLGNGENIMPTAIESDIYDALNAAGLKDVDILLAGTSRPIPALLVENSKGRKEDMQKVFDECFPRLSEGLPKFFPLKPHMVYYLDDDQELVRTVKGVPHRGKTELHYAKQLETLYLER